MITFHVHGSVELRAADGRQLLSVLSQPKRTALLAYLAIAEPGRFQRRDTLLNIFWPELDEQRARNSLSQALHYLRRSLGEGVIISRGDGEVGIAAGRLWCDAVALEEAMRGGRPSEVLEYYRGELLPGLNLDGVPDFERWLDLVRARQQEYAAGAAWHLAEEAESAGDLAGAVAWARRCAALRPDDEAVLRRLLLCLDRVGDRAGALHAFEVFAQRLELEYEAQPAPATIELMREIRERGGAVTEGAAAGESQATSPAARTGAPPAGQAASGPHPAGPPAANSVAGPTAAGSAAGTSTAGVTATPVREQRIGVVGRLSRRRGWPGLVVLAGGVVVLVLAGLFLHRWSDTGSGAQAGAHRAVVVFPFEIRGATELSYLGRGMTDLLSAKLDGALELRSVDPRAVLSAVDAAGSPVRGRREAGRIASRLGAGRFIMGSLTAHSGVVQLSAALYEQGRAEPITRTAVEGGAEEIFDLVDRLAAELLAEQHSGPGQELVRLAAATTTSLPALKSYLLGEEALRGGHYGLAMEHFREAAGLDTAFALAYYRLGVAAVWGSQGSQLSGWAVARAIEHDERLSERGRTLLQAFRAFIGRDAVEAERLYRAVLANHPDDVEAWYQLGEVLFHYRPLLGAPVEASAMAFERVLSFEPGHGESLIHLARIAARRGDRIALDSLVIRLVADGVGSDRLLELQALRAAVWRDSAAWARVNGSAYQLRDEDVWKIIVPTISHGGDLGAALQLARLQTHPSREPLFRSLGYGMTAQIELARGRWASARAQIEELARIEPVSALIVASIFAASPYTPVSVAEVEEVRARLVGLDVGAAPAVLPSLSLPRRYLPFVQHYLAGLLSVRLGDREGALEQVRLLHGLGGSSSDPGLGPGLAESIGAALAWKDQDLAGTLEKLAAVPLGPHQLKAALGYAAQGYERNLFGEALIAVGRDDEALPWFSSFPEPAGYDLIYLAPSHLRRAELHERQGDRERAAFHYDRFIELWEECDPELRPQVEAARERLAELRSANRG